MSFFKAKKAGFVIVRSFYPGFFWTVLYQLHIITRVLFRGEGKGEMTRLGDCAGGAGGKALSTAAFLLFFSNFAELLQCSISHCI